MDEGAIEERGRSFCRFSDEVIGITVPQNVMNVVVGPMQECDLEESAVKIRALLSRSVCLYWFCLAVIFFSVKPSQKCDILLPHRANLLGLWFLEKILSVDRRSMRGH